ncbi:hypothetical protein FOA52_006559 [Chlamydomonas sp. UWO 241]|nr:hypothetical protein FOA52_006559 [Chlamydomonas sp. UWO 241]
MLLEADPGDRLAHWAQDWEGVEAAGVLSHPFFDSNARMDMADLRRRMDTILNGEERIEALFDRLQAQMRMLSSLFSGDRPVPSLLCIVPVDASGLSWWKSADPSQWLQKEVLLYFVEPISLEFDPNSGFPLKFMKEWIRKSMAYVTVGLTVLKIVSAAGRLAGFPIPDGARNMNQMLADQLDAMALAQCIHDKTVEWVLPKHRAAFEREGSVLLAKGVISRSKKTLQQPSPPAAAATHTTGRRSQ